MPVIGWNEGSPQGSDSLGLGDDEIRSLKTSIRQGLDGEHIWPSGGGDAGVHRLGSARPYVGPQSLVSSTGTDGKLMFTSDTSRLFHVGSGGTALLGAQTMLSIASFPGTAPQRHYWAAEFGSQTVDLPVVQVIFPNSGFSGQPVVFVSAFSAAGSNIVLTLDLCAPLSFEVQARKSNSLTSNYTLQWFSIGTRVL